MSIVDIRGVFNAKRHPEVIEGKKTEEQVLTEFLSVRVRLCVCVFFGGGLRPRSTLCGDETWAQHWDTGSCMPASELSFFLLHVQKWG